MLFVVSPLSLNVISNYFYNETIYKQNFLAMKIKYLSLLLLFCVPFFASAQDYLHKKSGEKIEAKVLELALDGVRYKAYDNQDGPTYMIDNALLIKVVFEDGKEVYIQEAIDNPEYYSDQKKRVIKFGFFSPLMGRTRFGFEQSISNRQSFTANLGIIGLGINNETNASGVFASIGYRFYLSGKYRNRGMRLAHVLHGSYFMPEVLFGGIEYDDDNFNGGNVRENEALGALFLNYGKQWILGDIFLIDFNLGLGYSIGDEDSIGNRYSYSQLGNFATKSNFSIGILF